MVHSESATGEDILELSSASIPLAEFSLLLDGDVQAPTLERFFDPWRPCLLRKVSLVIFHQLQVGYGRCFLLVLRDDEPSTWMRVPHLIFADHGHNIRRCGVSVSIQAELMLTKFLVVATCKRRTRRVLMLIIRWSRQLSKLAWRQVSVEQFDDYQLLALCFILCEFSQCDLVLAGGTLAWHSTIGPQHALCSLTVLIFVTR